MIVLLILLAILILLMLTKVGVDAAYDSEGVKLDLKIGLIRRTILPKPNKPAKAKKPKKPKQKKEKPKKSDDKEKSGKPKRKLDLAFILQLAKIGLHALDRFRIRLRIDLFRLRLIMASSDPYTTATTCGYIQAAIGMLAPRIRRTFTVRDSHVEIGTDFLADKPDIEARLVLTIRIGSIFAVLFATGFEFLRYMLKRKRQQAKKSKNTTKDQAPVTDGEEAARKSA